MTKIKHDELAIIVAAIRAYLRDMDLPIEIYTDGYATLEEHPEKFGVNWSCVGTVAPAEALRFAEGLRFAAKICEELNSREFVQIWGENEFKSPDEAAAYFKKIYDGKNIHIKF